MLTVQDMATQLCDNCNREVPTENYVMHAVHCKRNVQICPHCGDAVSLREQKEHFEQFHEKIDCVQCGKKVTRDEEGNHLAYECGKRPVTCKYCEISLPRERMEDHEEFCGSRTDLCEKCSKYVLIRDIQEHTKSCDGGITCLPCEFCSSLVPADKLTYHQQQCFMEEQCVQVPLLVEDEDGIIREFATSSDGENSREAGEETTGTERCDGCADSQTTTDGSQDMQGETNSTVVALPCEICGELCPSDKLLEHQIECSEETESGVAWNPAMSHRVPPSRGFEDFHFTARSSRDISASDVFDEFFFNHLHERLIPFEMIRRSLFTRM